MTPLKESDEDYVFICDCININKLPSCQAVIVDGKLENFLIWYPPKHLSIIKTGHLWCVYIGEFSNEKIGWGTNPDLTLDEAVAILKRYINLTVFI